LNRGEVYSSYFAYDGSGKHIIADKSVAYFVTNSCVNIPVDAWACDCLYQQLYAESLWGARFFVPVTIRGKERVRIIASQNNTTINLTGGTLISGLLTLNAGEWAEIEINSDQNGCYIEANNPVGVVAYLKGCGYFADTSVNDFWNDFWDNFWSNPDLWDLYDYYWNLYLESLSQQNCLGDPAMTWIPPIEQFIDETLVAPFLAAGSSILTEHHLLIVTLTSAKNLTEISTGGSPYTALTGGAWYDHSSGYSYYTLPLDDEDVGYSLKNPEGLIVLGYGLGGFESYYYIAGSATRRLDTHFNVNDVHYLSVEGEIVCDENIKVEAIVRNPMDAAPGHLRWFINDVEQTAFTDSLLWTVKLPSGSYTVSMIVKDENGEVDTLAASFVINMDIPESVIINDTIYIGDSYDKNGFNIPPQYSAGRLIETLPLQNRFGCGNKVILHLNVIPEQRCPAIEISRFFSPNSDGINDYWKIENIECYNYTNFPAKGWDGYYHGKPQHSTDYWYLITLDDGRNYVGHFTLLR
jgi:hypothetical protein